MPLRRWMEKRLRGRRLLWRCVRIRGREGGRSAGANEENSQDDEVRVVVRVMKD